MDIKDKIREFIDQLLKLATITPATEIKIRNECERYSDPEESELGRQYEEINIDELDDKLLNESIEAALNEIKALEELEESECSCNCNNHTVFVKEIKKYVSKHLHQPLTDKEFEDIETGFRLRWNYSTGQMVSDGEFEKSVEQYLVSIESPVHKKKMVKVVDLILEYMEQMEESGND
jgi:hypothetical protein